jgi:hypothetical protein
MIQYTPADEKQIEEFWLDIIIYLYIYMVYLIMIRYIWLRIQST